MLTEKYIAKFIETIKPNFYSFRNDFNESIEALSRIIKKGYDEQK